MDIRKVKKLIELLEASSVDEIEIKEGEESVRISRNTAAPIAMAAAPVLLISEDLDELFKLSDRILVLYEGKVMKEVEIENASIDSIGLAMAGINE